MALSDTLYPSFLSLLADNSIGMAMINGYVCGQVVAAL